MKLPDLLLQCSERLRREKEIALTRGLDSPIDTATAKRVGTAGTLQLYSLTLPMQRTLLTDIPITVLPQGGLDPTEGYVLLQRNSDVLVQLLDSLGQSTQANTIIPDTSGFLETAATRLLNMAAQPESYALGPAERLVSWLVPQPSRDHLQARGTASTSVLTTIWHENIDARWSKLAELIVGLLRQNKRILLIHPDSLHLDRLLGFLAKSLRAAALPCRSLISRYEVPTLAETDALSLQEFGFEWQMHGFFAKSRANKDALRKQYERFRELTPLLAYKGEKQRDLQEVKLLEWRLLGQLSEFQGKITEIDTTVAHYEALPIWKRLAMQTTGKNIHTLGDYRTMYERKIRELIREVEIAQARIRELTPEAAIPKDIRPEYEELKEEITRLGGTQKIRDMLAAGEGTNRQAFIQNKRLVLTTPGRVLTDALFTRVRFDVLIAEEAPEIPAPFLLGASGLIRERIVLSGALETPSSSSKEGFPDFQWRQHFLEPIGQS